MRTPTLLIVATLSACNADIEPYDDFDLPDVNPVSPTAGQEVGPDDHLDHISAWYFGHSN